MMRDTFRCFVAIPASDEVRALFSSFVGRVSPRFLDYRFGSAQNLHITLQFLGDVPRSSTAALAESLSSAAQGIQVFRVGFGEAGGFPEKGKPRILHLSVTQGADTLGLLAARVRKNLSALGYTDPKPYTPHITLGRERVRGAGRMTNIRSSWKDSYMQFLEESRVSAEWDVNEVLLMESVLYREGPVYTPRARIGLERAPHPERR